MELHRIYSQMDNRQARRIKTKDKNRGTQKTKDDDQQYSCTVVEQYCTRELFRTWTNMSKSDDEIWRSNRHLLLKNLLLMSEIMIFLLTVHILVFFSIMYTYFI